MTSQRQYAIGICTKCGRQQHQGEHDPYCYCTGNEAGGWRASRFRPTPVIVSDLHSRREDRSA